MEIQPRSFGDSIADLIAMLGKVWRPLLMPALVASGLVTIVAYFAFSTPGALDFPALALNEEPEAIAALSDEELQQMLSDFMSAFGVVALTSLAVYGLLFIAAARAVGEEVSAEPSDDSVLSVTLASVVPWLITLVLVSVGVAAGLFLLIVPGIWLAVSMTMVAPTLALERKGPLSAMRRSFQLVKGNWWETFGFLVLVGLIGATATQLIQFLSVPMLMVGNPSFLFGLTLALGVALQGLIVAAIGVGTAIWYFNLTARSDGAYELQLT